MKTLKKAIEIAKVKAAAEAQSEVDKMIAELKHLHPVCVEHCTCCWTGHSSGEHATVAKMQFQWVTDYVSYLISSLWRTIY